MLAAKAPTLIVVSLLVSAVFLLSAAACQADAVGVQYTPALPTATGKPAEEPPPVVKHTKPAKQTAAPVTEATTEEAPVVPAPVTDQSVTTEKLQPDPVDEKRTGPRNLALAAEAAQKPATLPGQPIQITEPTSSTDDSIDWTLFFVGLAIAGVFIAIGVYMLKQSKSNR